MRRSGLFGDCPYHSRLQCDMLWDALGTVRRVSTKLQQVKFGSELSVLSYCDSAAIHGYLLHGIVSEWLVLPRPRRRRQFFMLPTGNHHDSCFSYDCTIPLFFEL